MPPIRFVRHNHELSIAALVIGLLVAFAVCGPLLWRVDVDAVDVLASLSPPSLDHPIGTDNVGRDIPARSTKARVSHSASQRW